MGPQKLIKQRCLSLEKVAWHNKKILYLIFRDTPGIENPTRSWKSTKITNVKFDAHYNETSGRYGFGAGTKPFLIQIDFEAPEDISYMVGRGVGLLPELAEKLHLKKICVIHFWKIHVERLKREVDVQLKKDQNSTMWLGFHLAVVIAGDCL